MKISKRLIVSISLAVLFLAIPGMLAFAKELSSLVISGPGIKGDLILDDPGAMRKLQETGFLFGEFSKTHAPKDLGEGYSITAYLALDTQIVKFVQMDYYPAEEGGQGYIHYTGRLNGESMDLAEVDDWQTIPWKVAAVLHEELATHKVMLQPAVITRMKITTIAEAQQPGRIPADTGQLSPAWFVTGAVVLVLAGIAAWFLRRQSINRKTVTSE